VKIISSAQNPIIKNLLILHKKSKERKKQNLFVVEGKKEIERALLGSYFFKIILVREGSQKPFENFNKKINDFIFVKKNLFDKVSVRSGSEKYMGIGISKKHSFKDFKPKNNEVFLVANSIEKPGNIGALLRTCSALGVSGFILSDKKADLYNPSVIRSSLGGVFNIPILISDSKKIINYLKINNIKIISGSITEKSVPLNKTYIPKPCAIIVGSESKGLDIEWTKNSNEIIQIPMKNNIDSLNVSVAAAILIHYAIGN
tara:strand:+ start:3853 stop:4629 length:777 start_codon:yes stop_codon:yes gene_type:complete